jgi:hypothetical protein
MVRKTGYTISSRAVVFHDAETFESMLMNPKDYLESIGALDGFPAFNGVKDYKGSEDLWPMLNKIRNKEIDGPVVCFHIEGPVPNFCQWTCAPSAGPYD